MQRYDRQTRLWSDSGQTRLALARVFAKGQSCALVECLKNLALAGVNHFALEMPDDARYLSTSSLSQYLSELNPKTKVEFVLGCPKTVDLIIVDRKQSITGDYSAPCLRIESDALNGSVELQLRCPLPVIYTHPPPLIIDLGLTQVWPELREFCSSFDLASLDEAAFRHVPFLVLLIRAMSETRSTGTSQVKSSLKTLQRYGDEDNFREAFDNVYRLASPAVPEGVSALIEYGKTHEIVGNPMFGACLQALGTFIERNRRLPVSDELNDMTSTSENYARLKQIYADKARSDFQELGLLAADVPMDYVKIWARNCRHMKLLVPQPTCQDGLKPTKLRKVSEEEAGLELPPIAALIGGMASQEATKILSGHYTPINGRLMFNGETQTTELLSNIRIIN